MDGSGGKASLPVFVENDYEAHVSRYTELLQEESKNSLEKGAIASSARAKLGPEALDKLAWELGEAQATLYRNADVYDRLSSLPEEDLDDLMFAVDNGSLSYTHIRDVHDKVKDDRKFVELLGEAEHNGWRTKRLREEMAVRAMFEDNGARFSPPPQSDHHAPHGVTGPQDEGRVSGGQGVGSVSSGGQIGTSGEALGSNGNGEGHYMPSNAQLNRLVRSFEYACDLLASGVDNPEETLAYIEEMARTLDRLRKRLERSYGHTSAKEGGDKAKVTAS